MKKIISTFLLVIIFSILSAHEFWLQPDKFIYDRGEAINIRFNVGENFEGENWSGDTSKIQNLDFYFNDVKDDLRDAMGTEKGDSVQLSLLDEGTAMVTAYLLEDGLTNAIEYRQEHNETDSMGHEFYQRSVKTIFQVGTEFDNTFKQQTTLPLDIVPQANPYTLKDDQSIRFKVFFQKKLLKNTLINVWHRENNKTTKEELKSDDNGEIDFSVKISGEWMVSCVKMIRLENDPKAQWQSYWGSCTWGYE